METLVSEAEYKTDYYHNPQEHGPMWTLLNQMLHIIVLVYTIFGIIRFKVIFIRMVKLVRWISLIIVCLNWYISIKFAILAMAFYFFNMELDSRKISLLHFNCSLVEYESYYLARANSSGGNRYTIVLANLLHLIGGPYRLLGNRATLMYGFFSIGIYIMLALFPVEHYYFDIGFNYIRFVLNDPSCLHNCYAKKRKHLDRLNSWSRNVNSSMITLSMKRATNQRDLRSSYVFEQFFHQRSQPNQLPVKSRPPKLRALNSDERLRGGELEFDRSKLHWYDETYGLIFANRLVRSRSTGSSNDGKRQDSGLSLKVEEKLNAPVKSLRHSLSTNHSNEPSYNVKVANENLKRFKPYVRSESWFKISMLIYPIFIFYYFTLLMVVIGAITIFFTNTLQSVNDICSSGLKSKGYLKLDLLTNWSIWDQLTFYEGKYSVFALSCASSFYCSYYFGTILELLIWIEEVSQQLNLCRVIIELIEVRPPPICLISVQTTKSQQTSTRLLTTRGSRQQPEVPEVHPMLEALFPYHDSVRDCHLIGENFNQFGGLNSIWAHCKFRLAPQSERLRKYELMAIKLATKKQTILRATYINLNMFFDELNDTRFMTTIILRRTTQIAFAFALMVSLTRSQFETNVIYLSMLLFSCLAILNLYLICAAFINSSINKLLPQIHALISVSIMACTDHDLLEFWLRHIQAYGLDKDAMSYKIYGYKVTWSTILNFNGAVSSVYLFTVY